MGMTRTRHGGLLSVERILAQPEKIVAADAVAPELIRCTLNPVAEMSEPEMNDATIGDRFSWSQFMNRPAILLHDSRLGGARLSHTMGLEAPALVGDSLAAYEVTKRWLDVSLSALAMMVLAPVFLVIAALIKWADGGPIFYIHRRIGLNGQTFDFYKFRSMVTGADRLAADLATSNEHSDSRTFKMRRDPRVTPIGRILRRTSLDELPQLWNIFRGDMSLVGPRPALPREVALYTEIDRRRLTVMPGLTCLWQINGRAQLPFDEQIRLDLQYIESRSMLLDLKIIAGTIPAVLTGDGAY